MAVAEPPATVVVRTLNSAATVVATLDSLRSQTVRPEIIVVDSGSTDETLVIAERMADRTVHIEPGRFTFGRALNIGAQAARAPVHFALSSHSVAERRDWIERALEHYERPDVAGAVGQATRPDGDPLTEVFLQTAAEEPANPFWGFSNHASSWRASVWREFPFREDLTACEDLEWSARVRKAGHVIVYDPALVVYSSHRLTQGLGTFYRRVRKETLGVAEFRDIEPMAAREALRQWWSPEHHDRGSGRARQLVSPTRVAQLAGRWSAGRELRRRPRR
jgi:GT2 family glycosyltransferase